MLSGFCIFGFYDIEKLIDILVFLLKESYCNPDIAVDVKVKILENENKNSQRKKYFHLKRGILCFEAV